MNNPGIDGQITFLYTTDLIKTTNFYQNIMGFQMILDQGTCRIFRVAESSYIGFCHKETINSDDLNTIFTVVTTDVDGWYVHLKEHGISFNKTPEYNPKYQIYHFFLNDPNGYLIEIQRFEDPNWTELIGD
jgi:catechol 2,3-dioxygenase-like lactoylglutathione lyase family enzyme